MSYIYTLKSKYLNALNDVIKKITITENAKVIKNPLLEADNNFTSIIQSETQFDPSKINSNVLVDETENKEDEKKLEKKNKLKTMVLNKIKQSLEISDDLQAMLKEIDDINNDTQLNEWILNEKGNTAELKNKNAAIFKQNNQLCLSHDGKIEIFHSVPELHEWLKKNNYPLPKNIKLHESVSLVEKEDPDDFKSQLAKWNLKNSDKINQTNDDENDEDSQDQEEITADKKITLPNEVETKLLTTEDEFKEEYARLSKMYGPAYAMILLMHEQCIDLPCLKGADDDVTRTLPTLEEIIPYKKADYGKKGNILDGIGQKVGNEIISNGKVLGKIDKDHSLKDIVKAINMSNQNATIAAHKKMPFEDLKTYNRLYGNDEEITKRSEKTTNNLLKDLDNTNKKSTYIPNIKDITYNTNQNEDEKKLDLDDDFSWVFDEDCAVTTSNIGPAVQYTADKELDEDTLIETILQAESPYRNSEGKYDNDYVYGSFDRKNGVIHTRDKKFITKKDIISYYMKELQYLNDGHKNGTLTPSEQKLFNTISTSGMMDRKNPNSFISQLQNIAQANYMSDIGNYQYSATNAHMGKATGAKFDTLDANGKPQVWDSRLSLLPDIAKGRYNITNNEGNTVLDVKQIQNKMDELKDYLGIERIDFRWLSIPSCIDRRDKKQMDLWLKGKYWVKPELDSTGNPTGRVLEANMTDPDAYNHDDLFYEKDENGHFAVDNKGKRIINHDYDAYLTKFKEKLVQECFKKSVQYTKIDKLYNELSSKIEKEIIKSVEEEKEQENKLNKLWNGAYKKAKIKEIYDAVTNLYTIGSSLSQNKAILKNLGALIYGKAIKDNDKNVLIQKLMQNPNIPENDKNILNGFLSVIDVKEEASDLVYDLNLLKNDLSTFFNTKNESNYDLDLLKKDLSTNQKVLTEDESPQDFASNIDLNLSTDGSENSSENTSEAPIDTNSTPDIDLDSNPESADSGDNFGDINIGNMSEYGPDTENDEQSQVPTEPEKTERIIDVLENENGDLEVKVQNEDTKKVTTKKLYEIDV